jgi:hypothetical protein
VKPNFQVNIKGTICVDPGGRAFLKHRYAAARFLHCGFESGRVHGCVSLANGVSFQVKVSTPGLSFVQRSPTERGVSECDSETSTKKRPRLTTAVES